MNKISIGRTVLYVLSAQDAIEINRRRTHGGKIAELMAAGKWPAGAQAHIGNDVTEGDIYPAVAVRIFVGAGQEVSANTPVNLQVVLDGTDTYWATSRHEDAAKVPGTYHWPERV